MKSDAKKVDADAKKVEKEAKAKKSDKVSESKAEQSPRIVRPCTSQHIKTTRSKTTRCIGKQCFHTTKQNI